MPSSGVSSPDPWCTLRLDNLRGVWLLSLPVIHDARELADSPWRDYLNRLYGTPTLRPADFPVDMRCFTMFWARHIPASELPLFLPHLASNCNWCQRNRTAWNGQIFQMGARKSDIAWHVYLWANSPIGTSLKPGTVLVDDHTSHRTNLSVAADAPSIAPWFGLRPLPRSLRNRVEVFHDLDDCIWVRSDMPRGYWMSFAPGSGVFFDLGKTLAMARAHPPRAASQCRDEAASAFCRGTRGLQPRRWSTMPEKTADMWQQTVERMRVVGYDSWQALGSQPGGGYTYAYELVATQSDCHSHGTFDCPVDRGACPQRGLLTRGRSSPATCECDTSLTVINCDGTCSGPGTIGPGTTGPGIIGPGTMGPGTMGPGTMAPGTMGGLFRSLVGSRIGSRTSATHVRREWSATGAVKLRDGSWTKRLDAVWVGVNRSISAAARSTRQEPFNTMLHSIVEGEHDEACKEQPRAAKPPADRPQCLGWAAQGPRPTTPTTTLPRHSRQATKPRTTLHVK